MLEAITQEVVRSVVRRPNDEKVARGFASRPEPPYETRLVAATCENKLTRLCASALQQHYMYEIDGSATAIPTVSTTAHFTSQYFGF